MLAAFDDQDEVFSAAFSVLREAIEQRAFPGASVAVTYANKLLALKAFGNFVYGEDFDGESVLEARLRPRRTGECARPYVASVGPDTLFDLASVTKAVATTSMAAILYERGQLELDAPVVGVIPEFRGDANGVPDARRREVTSRMLLAHSSGLPAYEKLFLRVQTRDELLRAAFTMPLTADPGRRAEYSDIGFIVLGIALERIAQESIDVFCQREIFGPLGMANTSFNPPAEARSAIAPTADDRTFRNRIIQGEVQDENAFVLGGVAGHAGMFSTAENVSRFAYVMLQGGSPILRRETVALFTRREAAPAGTSRALGWDTPSTPSQSGKHFGTSSYGHLGYTGTSLWIDPERRLSITLLTNRTWPDCSNQAIKRVRPKFHDAVVEALAQS